MRGIAIFQPICSPVSCVLTTKAFSNSTAELATMAPMAADPQLYRRGLVRLVQPAWRERIDGALLASGQVLSRWLLGVPLAATIGVIAGVLASIPFFGPIASGILAMLLAFTQGPAQALYVAGLCVVIQQVEGNLLMRFVQR